MVMKGTFRKPHKSSKKQEGLDELTEEAEIAPRRSGAKVRVMVDITNRGNGIKYLSWKEQHV